MPSRAKYMKQYRQENKEHIAIKAKKYYGDHKEHLAEWGRKYKRDNKEYQSKLHQKWLQSPAGRASIKAQHHNRRAMLKGLTIAIIQSVYEDNIKKYGRLTCILCFKPIEFGTDSLEHLTPLSRGGSNDFANLGIAHNKCNKQKGAKTLSEWFNK